MQTHPQNKIAVWAITPNGLKVAEKMTAGGLGLDLYISANFESHSPEHRNFVVKRFERLADALEKRFFEYSGHIFIMSTGIVVRMIAPHIRSKLSDPAVVVVDEKGLHAISLLAGHLGGANRLARQVAEIIGAKPVITTATDLNAMPAIDLMAVEKNLSIQNPAAIKKVSMTLLRGQKVGLYDPYGLLADDIARWPDCFVPVASADAFLGPHQKEVPSFREAPAGVVVSDRIETVLPQVLVLRPKTLAAGIGCNRGTDQAEIEALLMKVLHTHGLAIQSLACLATIDIKADEAGIMGLARKLNLKVRFYGKDDLGRVETIETPSTMVEKHVGVKSVCEAAAILATENGRLIVPKQTTPNVTLAMARHASISSAPDPVI